MPVFAQILRGLTPAVWRAADARAGGLVRYCLDHSDVAIGEVAGSKREDFALSTTRQESAPKLLSLAMAQHGSPCQKSADICRNALLVVMASRLCATGRATP